MAKIIAWLVVIFIVLLALRMINMRNARKARGGGSSAAPSSNAQPMVRCVRCDVYLPRVEATPVEGGYACADGQCAKR
jgi:hypothetical protein